MPLKYNQKLKRWSRRLRGGQTEAEKLLWSKIRKKQIKDAQFNRQKPIGNYIVDFYCDKAKLIIEIDGGQHYEGKGILQDKNREKYFNGLGLEVIRFTNLDVLKNVTNVVEEIYKKINPPPALI